MKKMCKIVLLLLVVLGASLTGMLIRKVVLECVAKEQEVDTLVQMWREKGPQTTSMGWLRSYVSSMGLVTPAPDPVHECGVHKDTSSSDIILPSLVNYMERLETARWRVDCLKERMEVANADHEIFTKHVLYASVFILFTVFTFLMVNTVLYGWCYKVKNSNNSSEEECSSPTHTMEQVNTAERNQENVPTLYEHLEEKEHEDEQEQIEYREKEEQQEQEEDQEEHQEEHQEQEEYQEEHQEHQEQEEYQEEHHEEHQEQEEYQEENQEEHQEQEEYQEEHQEEQQEHQEEHQEHYEEHQEEHQEEHHEEHQQERQEEIQDDMSDFLSDVTASSIEEDVWDKLHLLNNTSEQDIFSDTTTTTRNVEMTFLVNDNVRLTFHLKDVPPHFTDEDVQLIHQTVMEEVDTSLSPHELGKEISAVIERYI